MEVSDNGIAWIILNAVSHQKLGRHRLAEFLKGSRSKDVSDISESKGFGGLYWHDIPTIEGFIEQLEGIGLIERIKVPHEPFDYSYFSLTEAGTMVLQKRETIPLVVSKVKKPVTLGKSDLETLRLLDEGKTIQEIIAVRGLVTTTIYLHLCKLISAGRISTERVVPKDIIDRVEEAAKRSVGPTLSGIKQLLPNISYEEIRCVLAGRDRKVESELVSR